MNDKIRIVVLDSGLDPNCKLAKEMNFSGGIGFYETEDGTITIKNNEIDDIGHGTGVASIIYKMEKDVELIPVKIIYDGFAATTSILIESLKYINENIECDIINISAGVVCCDDINGLYDCCKTLKEKGVILVSAYDNDGVVSYPASFDCVIGIDGTRKKWGIHNFKKISGENADYLGVIIEKRLPWVNSTFETVSGNSFLAPEFSAKVANLLKNKRFNFEEMCDELDKMAFETTRTYHYGEQSIGFEIKKAIIFPFNKEMHSLARYQDLLDFEVKGYYDVKYSGNIGHSILELQNINNDILVQNIEALDWSSDFDTVILGHTTILSEAIGKDLETYIVKKCIEHKKNLYSCKDLRNREDILNSDIHYNCPYIDPIPESEFSKMHVIGCPVVGVVGTGGAQGKYTLQLGLRRELKKRGYHVGQLGTEPTAMLFGMDAVYPMGHESSVYVKGFKAVYALNQLMGNIEKKNPDLIIFGSQSHTVPFQVGGPKEYPVVQHELLLGCQADGYILCINNDAPIDYIKRTISYLEGVYESEVIALVVSPLSIVARWSTIQSAHGTISKEEMDQIINNLKDNFSIPILPMSDFSFYEKIADVVTDYFEQ